MPRRQQGTAPEAGQHPEVPTQARQAQRTRAGRSMWAVLDSLEAGP